MDRKVHFVGFWWGFCWGKWGGGLGGGWGGLFSCGSSLVSGTERAPLLNLSFCDDFLNDPLRLPVHRVD